METVVCIWSKLARISNGCILRANLIVQVCFLLFGIVLLFDFITRLAILGGKVGATIGVIRGGIPSTSGGILSNDWVGRIYLLKIGTCIKTGGLS